MSVAVYAVGLVPLAVAYFSGQWMIGTLIFTCGVAVSIPIDLACSAQAGRLQLGVVAELLWVVVLALRGEWCGGSRGSSL